VRARSPVFWWGIVFLTVYELFACRQVGEVLKTERRDTCLLEYVGITDVTIIKQRNDMIFCFNDKLYNALLYWPCARTGVVRIQNPYSIFNRRTKSEEMFSCINYWKGKGGWQFPF
jgi:hypothetical protein